MKTFKTLMGLLTLSERKQAGALLGMIFLMALLDMLGVASIMPFMAVLANPQLVETNTILNTAFNAASAFGITTPQHFLFALGILVFLLLIVSLTFKAFTVYAQIRFALMREYSISKRLVEGYLHQPYSWFLNRNSADLGKNILSEVNQVIHQAVIPAMNFFAQGVVVVAMLVLLFMVEPRLAFTIGMVLGTAYGIIFKVASGFLSRIGKERVSANQARFVAVSEAFGAAKEVKVGGLEQAYIQRFSFPAKTFARHQASASVISQLPRFAIEAIAFGGMLLVMLYLMAQSGNFSTVLPIIALYAFAGYRIMPALQQIYGAVTQLRYSGPALEALHKDMMSLQLSKLPPSRDDGSDSDKGAVPFNHAITLNNIHYRYPNASRPALEGISLTIPARRNVGVVGCTGSGKTTVVDLILGLLEPQQGTLEIDSNIINESNRRSWQRSIGYVPQQIYLADDTIVANIALGIEPKYIDHDAVEHASKIANLHDFVVNELPSGYQTLVGERGVCLSGGQSQRIGIARALYHCPQVLILDEATSALDNLTERMVMEAVHNLGHGITVIMVAHRLSTVKECDIIFLLDKGELKETGSYEELSISSKTFQKMTGAVV